MTARALDSRALPPLLTTRQVAELLHLHINTVKKLCRSGKLPAFKAAAGWRIQRADLLAFMEPGTLPAGSGSQTEGAGMKEAWLEQLRRQQQRLQILHEIDRAVLAAQSPGAIAEAAARGILQVTDAARVGVGLWHIESNEFEMLAVVGHSDPPGLPGRRFPLRDCPWYAQVRQGQAVVQEDLAREPERSPEGQAAMAQGVLSYAVIPLRAGPEVIGHLALARCSAGPLPDEDLALVQHIADSLAVAVHNAGLLEAAQQARQTLETLQAANAAVTQSLELDIVLEKLLDYLGQLIPYDSANVMLRRGDDAVAVRAMRGYERWTDPSLTRNISFEIQATPAIREMFSSQQSLLVPDTGQYAGWESPPGAEHMRSWLAVPLAVSGKVLGLFSVDKAEAGFFRQEHVRLAEALASQAAVAIQNAQLYAEVMTGRGQMQGLSRRLVEVQEQERRALSRDLHDTSGQNITALKVGLSALKRAEGCSESVRAGVDELVQLADTVAEELHRLAVNLRPSSLDRYGLVPALEQLLTEFRKQTGLEVDFAAHGIDARSERLPGNVESTLYRIVQESLTNVARYAQAQNVCVLIQARDDEVQVIVEDDGRGFDVEEALRSGRLGLLGMRERAEMLGGTLTIESLSGQGTTVYCTVPACPAETENAATGRSANPLAVAPARVEAGNLVEPHVHLAEAADLARAKALSDVLVEITAGMARHASGSNARELLGFVLARSAEAIGCDYALILRREGDHWIVSDGYHLRRLTPGQRLRDSEAPTYVTIERTGEMVVVNDSSAQSPLAGHHQSWAGRSGATIPLLAGGQFFGVVSYVRDTAGTPFTPSEVEFLQRLSSLVSIAMENIHLHEIEARQQAELAQRVEELEVQEEELRSQNEELFASTGRLQSALAALKESEENLRRSEAMYRAIARSFPSGNVTVLDHDLRYLVAGGEAFPLMGLSPEAMVGKTLWEVYAPETAAGPEACYRAGLAGQTARLDFKFRERTFVVDYRPIWDEVGRVVAVLAASRDITERIHMEEALRRSEKRYRLLFSSMDQGFALIRMLYDEAGKPADYLILEVNPAYERLTGLTRKTLVGKTARSFDQNMALPAIVDYGRVAQTGEPARFETYSVLTQRWWDVSAYTPGPDLVAVIFADITGRKQAESDREAGLEELRRQRARYEQLAAELEAILSSMADGLMVYDASGEIRRLNDAAERIVGYSLREDRLVVGDLAGRLQACRPDGHLLPPAESPVGRALRGETVQGSVMVLQRPDATIWVSASAAPILGPDGSWRGAVASFTDITALHDVQQQLEETYQELEVAHDELQTQAEELVGVNAHLTEAAERLSQREAALRRSEATYRAIAQNFPNGAIYAFDHDLRFLVAEGEVLAGLNLSREQLEGKTIWEALDPETARLIEPRYRHVLAGETLHLDTSYRGHVLASHYVPIRDAWGQVSMGMVVTQDITQRQRMAEELERQTETLQAQNDALQQLTAEVRQLNAELEQRVQERTAELEAANRHLSQKEASLQYQANLLENIHDAIVATDTSLRITAWNHGAEEQYGWKADEVMGAYILDVVTSHMSAEQRAAANRVVLETGHWRGEVMHKRRDGTPILTEATTIVLRDPAGQTTGYASVHRDITDRRRAEQAIQQQARRLAILHEIDRSILAARSPEEIAQSAVAKLHQDTSALRVAVALYDHAAGEAAILAIAGPDSPLIAMGSRWPLSTGWMVEQLQAGRVATVEDVAELPESHPFKATRLSEGIRSATLIPMKAGAQVIGQLTVHAAERGGLGQEDLELATQVADSLAVAIHNARLSEELVRRQAELTQANEALRYQAELLANINDAIFACDPTLHITSWNRAAEAQYGRRAEEVLGAYAPDVLGSHVSPEEQAAILQALAGTGRWQGQVTHTGSDGTPIIVESTVQALYDGSSRISGYVSMNRDVTERKRAEEDLAAQAERLREQAALLDLSDDAIYVRALDGTLRFWNRGAAELYGWSPEEALGQIAHELLQTVFPDSLAATQGQAVQAGRWEGELIQTRRDGTRMTVASRWALWRDNEGRPAGALVVNTDISEQKRAQERIVYQANLLENVSDAIVAFDAELRITAWNHAAEAQYGWQAGEVLGAYSPEVLGSQLSPEQRAVALRAMHESGRWQGEILHRRRDGTPIIVEATSMALRDPAGHIFAHVTVNRDITERKRSEEAIRLQSQRLAILHEVDCSILAARAPAEIAQAAIERMQPVMGARRLTVVLGDFAAQTAEILAEVGASAQGYGGGARRPLAEYPLIAMVKAGQVATIADFGALPEDWPPKEATLRAGVRSATLVPLMAAEQVIGVLTISPAEPGALPPEALELAHQVADSLAVALASARLAQQVQAGREQLQALSRRLVDMQERERRFVADQLFNQIEQVLAALKLQLGTLRPAVRREPEASQRLNEMQETLDSLMRELHGLASGLRPASLDRLGLVAALGQYVTEFSELHHVAAEFAAFDLERVGIPADVETALYRIAQEALANAAQHSGATEVHVMLHGQEGRLALIIEDDGIGFDLGALNPQSALGLAAMRERAESLGGSLTIETGPGSGTVVLVGIPF